MTIEKLTEFAKTGQKDTDQLDLEVGFIVNKKPARQWFNWLFNTLTLKINEMIDAEFIPKTEIIDNLTTDEASKPVSAKQAKYLNDNKLGKTENAESASKLQAARTISFSGAATGSFNFDGSANSSAILTLANSGVVANTYGSSLKTPVLTVNQKGLITGVSEQQIPIVDDLTTGGSTKLLSAEQGKLLQDNKLEKTALNNTLTSTSSTQALTAAQGKVLNDRAFGRGQTYKDVTALRAKSTIYTNPSSTQDMLVIISVVDNASGAGGITVTVGGDAIISGANIPAGSTSVTFIVGPLQEYKLDLPGSNNIIEMWKERS